MRKLFAKIFLSFWLLIAVVSVVTFAVIFERLDERQKTVREVAPRERIAALVTDAQRIADERGRNALEDWLRGINEQEPLPIFLLDEQGQDILGRNLPEYIELSFSEEGRMFVSIGPAGPRGGLRMRIPGERGPSDVAGDGSVPPRARPPVITLDDGSRLVLVPDFGGITVGRLIASNALFIFFGLTAMVLFSGLVCFALARHVTRPLTEMKDVIHQWGRGQLSLRSPTHIGRRNDELAGLARDLDEMAERLQTLIESQQQLLSDVSHELRSPLTRLIMAAALLRRKSSDRPLPELERIEQEATLLGDNIDRILFLARLDVANRLPSLALENVYELAKKSAEAMALTFRSPPHIHVFGDPKTLVHGDGGLLRIALDNVIGNAVKYSRGSDLVEVEVRYGRNGCVQVHVRDSGPGVPATMLSRIFDRFVRVDPSRSSSTGGLGLGLAITSRAIALHSGLITARNREPTGLEVTIVLPTTPKAAIDVAT